MRLRWAALNDRLRSSLFFEPMLFVLGAIVLAALLLWVDATADLRTRDLPFGMTSTVDSARSVLSTIASATVTVAGIAFSIALLVVQQASSQYSPRVVQGLFRDSFNKRVMGFVIGTFTYCLVVLRSVRSPIEDGGDPVIPNISVALAVVLGIASILAIVAFINHNAHSMEVSELLDTVADQTIDALAATWSDEEPDQPAGDTEAVWAPALEPLSVPFVVRFRRNGWLQYIDHGTLLKALPDGSAARLDSRIGQYAISGAVLCTIWPRPADEEHVDAKVRDAVHIGATRTMAQDPAYGLRQIADVALKALSPGVNDPTTAQEAIVHLGAVLSEAYRRFAPPHRRVDERGCTLADVDVLGHREVTDLAFDEIRRVGASQPQVARYLLETMGTLLQAIEPHSCNGCEQSLRRQAALTLDECSRSGALPEDLSTVRATYDSHFGA